MSQAVIGSFEPVYVDVSGHKLSAVALGAIDLSSDRSETGAAAAYPGQLVSPGILTVLRSLRAIRRCNLAVVTALRPIVRRDLAIVYRTDAAVRCVLLPLAVARRAIACSPIQIARRIVTRFGIAVAQPCRDVPVSRGQTSLTTAHGSLLVGPGILAVFRRLRAVLCGDLAVVDGSLAAVGCLSTTGIGAGAFVGCSLPVARCAIPRGAIAISCSVVTSFGLAIPEPGRNVAVSRRQAGLAAAHRCQLVSA
jgi:hypothetical protein